MKNPTLKLLTLFASFLVLLTGCAPKETALPPPPTETTNEEKEAQPLPLYLPIGSIVTLQPTQQKVMVVGYAPQQIDSEFPTLWDYSGCAYPSGILTPEELYMFNQEDILDVLFVGYTDSSFQDLLPFIDNALKEDVPLLI